MGAAAENITDDIKYNLIPTIKDFHQSGAQIRCIVGPVGSGKTTGATWEICYYLPHFLFQTHRIKKTRWLVLRNTYSELRDTTLKTIFEWFPWGEFRSQAMEYTLYYPDQDITVELLFRSCDRPDDVKKFKSLELTGYWIDESIEVADEVKRMLKNRIGRYPRKSPVRFGVETTNPPDVEHTTYSQFAWTTPPPGPMPQGKPLEGHVGFWQPPRENEANLRAGYYDDLIKDYADNPDWIDMYVNGKPGQLVRGRLVYANFVRTLHVAEQSLIWDGQQLYRGWDHNGTTPACIVVCPVTPTRLHIYREFVTVQENIVDFTRRVLVECAEAFPGGRFVDVGDPAGRARFSTRSGGFTSNTDLMRDECGVHMIDGEQTFRVRVNCVDQALLRRDGVLIDPSCIRLINGFLGGYHYPELAGMPGVYKKDPEKNKFSHIHDALQYALTRLYVSSGAKVAESDCYPDEIREEVY